MGFDSCSLHFGVSVLYLWVYCYNKPRTRTCQDLRPIYLNFTLPQTPCFSLCINSHYFLTIFISPNMLLLAIDLHFGLFTLEERLRVGQMLMRWTEQCPRSSSILNGTPPYLTMTSPSWNSAVPSTSLITSGPSVLHVTPASSAMLLTAIPPAGGSFPTQVSVMCKLHYLFKLLQYFFRNPVIA